MRRSSRYRADESACKPGSVLMRIAPGATIHLDLPLPTGSSDPPAGSGGPPSNACASDARAALLDLAPGGVYRAASITRDAGGLLHRRFTLTSARAGGLFSVALSRGSPRVAVNNHPALWSPDFPRRGEAPRRGRPAGSSAVIPMLAETARLGSLANVPGALAEAIAIAILALSLVVAIARPLGLSEAVVAVPGATLIVATGIVSAHDALDRLKE